MLQMNVQPIPTASERVNEIRALTAEIVNREIPAQREHVVGRDAGRHPPDRARPRAGAGAARRRRGQGAAGRALGAPPAGRVRRRRARLPRARLHERGAGLRRRCSLAVRRRGPNSGNQTILVKYGTEEQKKKWLEPLIDGTMESGFSMTEPDQPGSDPRSIKTTRGRDGDEWVINGHKWFTSNGQRPTSSSSCAAPRTWRAAPTQRDDDPDHRPDGHAGREHRSRRRPVWGRTATTARSTTTTCACRLTNQLGRPGRPPGRPGPPGRRPRLPLHELAWGRCGGPST